MPPLLLAVLLAISSLLLLFPFRHLRFLAREFPGRGRRLTATVGLVAILSVAVFYPAISAEDVAFLEPDQIWFPGLFAGHVLLAAFLFAWWRLQRRRSLLDFLHLRRSRIDDLWLGVRAGLGGWALTIATMVGLGFAAMPFTKGGQVTEVPALMIWLAHLPLGHKLLVIAAAMTVEEAFFRAFLQSRIGWIPSSLVFALAHASYGLPLMLAGVLVISLVIGWIFRRTDRLLPCVVAHGVFDGIQLLVVIPLAVEFAARGGWVVG